MFTYRDFVDDCINPFQRVDYIYDKARGWIAWRLGTGGNVELLHIKTFYKGKGYGRQLFYEMLEKLSKNPPYHSVFGYTRVSNLEAQKFYGVLGFDLQTVNGIYQDGRAILFYQEYRKLIQLKVTYENSSHLQIQSSLSK